MSTHRDGVSPREQRMHDALHGRIVVTDGEGNPFVSPGPWDEVEPFTDWLKRYHAWRDAITACGNAAFDNGLQRALANEVQP